MSSNSSDGETKDGSSSEPELTELMQTSTGAVISLLGKRRAETSTPEDSSESDGGAEGEGNDVEFDGDEEGVEDEGDEDGGMEISRSNEEDSVPEWGYDSFDEREYDSSDQKEYADKEFEMQCRYYRRQLIETKGFFEPSEKFPACRWAGVASIWDLEEEAGDGLTIREFCAKLTCLCLERYNEEEGLNVKLGHIMRANYNPGPMSKFYITFAARESESPDAPLVEYQAKAAWSVENQTYPIFCRPTKREMMMEEMLNEVAKVVEETS